MTRLEIDTMIGALSRRYQRQSDALKTPTTGPGANAPTHGPVQEQRTPLSGGVNTTIEALAKGQNPSLMSAFNVKVKAV